MIESLKHEEFPRMAVMLWALWHAQWKLIHEYINQSSVATHQFVEVFLQDCG
jgi:hypothetical protein